MTRKPQPNYDYTATARNSARRARAVARLDVSLDEHHAECVRYITDETGEPAATMIRRLIREEASRRDAPVETP